MFLLYYLVFRSRKRLEKILLMSGLVCLVFLDWLSGVFWGDVSGPEMPHFCCPKTACEKFSLSLLFFRSSTFVTRWFLEGFGARAPLLVLEMFLVGSGCAFLYGFCIRYREFFPPFLGSAGASLLFLSLPSFVLLLSSGGRPGFPSSSFSAPGCRTPDYRYLHRRELIAAHVFLCLLVSARVGRLPPLSSPSLLLPSLSLSPSLLSLSCVRQLPANYLNNA